MSDDSSFLKRMGLTLERELEFNKPANGRPEAGDSKLPGAMTEKSAENSLSNSLKPGPLRPKQPVATGVGISKRDSIGEPLGSGDLADHGSSREHQPLINNICYII